MGKIFDLNSPFFRFMERVGDFIIVNILTILCSIPLVTAGAALTAHHKVMQNMVMDFDQPILKSYFRAFAKNFKQATAMWLITAAVLALAAFDIFLVYLYLDGIAMMLYVLLGIISAIACGASCYAFALIARYENTFKQHLKNSVILAVGNLPKTLLLLLVGVLAVGVVVLSFFTSLNILLIMVFIGISLVVYTQTLILKPIFGMLEQTSKADNEQESEGRSL